MPSLLADALAAPFPRLAEACSRLITPYIPHTAVLVKSRGSRGSESSFGDRTILDRIRSSEFEKYQRVPAAGGNSLGSCGIDGQRRTVLAFGEAGHTLLLFDPRGVGQWSLPRRRPTGRRDDDGEVATETVQRLWGIISVQVQGGVGHRTAGDRENASEVRAATADLRDRHALTLESLLLTLRSARLDDRSARRLATTLAAGAVIRLHREPLQRRKPSTVTLASAFSQLTDELQPLTMNGDVDLELVEPSVGDRALSESIVHHVRAVVHRVVLAILEQPGVTRMRVKWAGEGASLCIEIRADGPGTLSSESVRLQPALGRVHALHGALQVSGAPGWGSEVTVTVPVAPPVAPRDEVFSWGLAPRELEVLTHMVDGKRNRAIAQDLGISENTVKFHVSKILRKLEVRSRSEAVAAATKNYLLTPW